MANRLKHRDYKRILVTITAKFWLCGEFINVTRIHSRISPYIQKKQPVKYVSRKAEAFQPVRALEKNRRFLLLARFFFVVGCLLFVVWPSRRRYVVIPIVQLTAPLV